MLPELTLGIMERAKDSVDGAALRALVSSRFYEEEAPENPTYPYVVFYDMGNHYAFDEFLKPNEFQTIEFSVFDDGYSNEVVKNIYKAIVALFDNCEQSLSVNGFTVIECLREMSILTRDPDDNSWSYKVQYEIQLEA